MFRFPKDLLVGLEGKSLDFVPEYSEKDRPFMDLAIDQYDGEDFNQNDFGHIRNDISALARAQSQQEYDLIMKKLQVLRNTNNLPKDIEPQDAIRLVKSRYLQSPNELLSFAEHLANGDMQKINDAYEQAIADQVRANADKVDTPVDTPVES